MTKMKRFASLSLVVVAVHAGLKAGWLLLSALRRTSRGPATKRAGTETATTTRRRQNDDDGHFSDIDLETPGGDFPFDGDFRPDGEEAGGGRGTCAAMNLTRGNGTKSKANVTNVIVYKEKNLVWCPYTRPARRPGFGSSSTLRAYPRKLRHDKN